MSEYSRGRKFKALSSVTKRLISGPLIKPDTLVAAHAHRHFEKEWNGAFITLISKIYGVTITSRKKPEDVMFNIMGTADKVQKAHALLTHLDQHAGVIAKEQSIRTPREISATDFAVLKVHLHEFLDNPQSVLGRDYSEAVGVPANSDQAVNEAIQDAENIIEASASPKQTTPPKPKQKGKSNNQPKNTEQSLKIVAPVFEPVNVSQAIAYTGLRDPGVSVSFLVGPAGGGKTYVPTHFAIEELSAGNIDKILLFRPRVVTGGKDLGAMPGDMKKKMEPYVKVFASKFKEITGKNLPKTDMIDALTPDTERGESHINSVVIVDEAQNLTREEAVMLQTRMGHGSRFIFTGDISNFQNDLKGQHPGLAHLLSIEASAANRYDKDLREGMSFVAFTEEDAAARHPLMPNILKAFNNPDDEYKELLRTIEASSRNSVLAQAIGKAVEHANREFKTAAEYTYGKYIAEVRKNYSHLLAHEGNVVPLVTKRAPELNLA